MITIMMIMIIVMMIMIIMIIIPPIGSTCELRALVSWNFWWLRFHVPPELLLLHLVICPARAQARTRR